MRQYKSQKTEHTLIEIRKLLYRSAPVEDDCDRNKIVTLIEKFDRQLLPHKMDGNHWRVYYVDHLNLEVGFTDCSEHLSSDHGMQEDLCAAMNALIKLDGGLPQKIIKKRKKECYRLYPSYGGSTTCEKLKCDKNIDYSDLCSIKHVFCHYARDHEKFPFLSSSFKKKNMKVFRRELAIATLCIISGWIELRAYVETVRSINAGIVQKPKKIQKFVPWCPT